MLCSSMCRGGSMCRSSMTMCSVYVNWTRIVHVIVIITRRVIIIAGGGGCSI